MSTSWRSFVEQDLPLYICVAVMALLVWGIVFLVSRNWKEKCPACGRTYKVDRKAWDSVRFGKLPCPHCGHLIDVDF